MRDPRKIAEAVARLDALSLTGNGERDHLIADEILLPFVPEPVAAAWDRARKRCGFRYA